MYDICFIGPITKDIIVIRNKVVEKPGGVVYYSSLTARKFKLKVCVITKLNEKDTFLIEELKKNNIVDVFWKNSKNTTTFKNIYLKDVNQRKQEVLGISEPFKLEDINIKAKIYYFGPLTKFDLDTEIYKEVKKDDNIVVLDIQGHLRNVKDKKVYLEPLEDVGFLKYVDILKANEEEIKIITGKEDIIEGALELSKYSKEVLVTLGDKGSIVVANNKVFRIPVFKPRRVVDPTGCGDVYTSTYVCMRYKGFSIESSAIFASVLAGLNVEKEGFNIPLELNL